jgi:hypothetical protein
MSERPQPEDAQDPEPIKHSDAQRLTESEAQQVPTRKEDEQEEASGQPDTEPD